MDDILIQMPPSAALDKPDQRDLEYSELVFGDTAPVVKVQFPYSRVHIPNQGADPLMYMSCTRQGVLNINNAQNIVESDLSGKPAVFTDPKVLWQKRIAEKPSVQKDGDSLQSALNQMIAEGLIAGYSRVGTIDAMIDAVMRGHWLYSGSNNWNWTAVREQKIYSKRTDGQIVGHAFAAGVDVDVAQKTFKGINSYGDNNGYFDIPFDEMTGLYTIYAIADARDEAAIAAYQALKNKKRLEYTANSPYSQLLIDLRMQTGKLPLFNNYNDSEGITKEITEIWILRYLVNQK